MQAVAESASDKILVLIDELLGEGHSPTHFARQLVRFLRNVTVAKIAGQDSAATASFLRRTRARGAHRGIVHAKKSWRGTCKSCCARTANSATARSSVSTWNWDC